MCYRRTHRSCYISTESKHVLEQFINVYEKIDCVKNYNGKYYFNKIYINNNLYFTSRFITLLHL